MRRFAVLAAIAFTLILRGEVSAMAVKQPGGPGTKATVYDDLHANAGGDGSYQLADVKAALDVLNPGQADIEPLVGQISGLPFSATRKQWLVNIPIDWGGDAADGFAQTTWLEKNVDIFWRVGGPGFRVGGGPIATRFGTKIGVGPSGAVPATMAGLDGVNIFLVNATFRNDLYLYGSAIICSGILQVLATGATVHEIAGNIIDFNGSTSVMGDSTTVGDWYNNLIMSKSATAVWGTSRHHDEDGNIIGAPTPLQILGLGAANGSIRARRPRYVGAPTRVIQFTGSDASDIKILSPIVPTGVRLFNYSTDKTPDKAGQEWSTINTRIGSGSTPLAGIPVRLQTDVEGIVVETITFSDGDLGFVPGNSGYQNGVLVREHGQVSAVPVFRDRIYTLIVNEAGLANPRNHAYGSRRIVFQWSGRTSGLFRPMEIAIDLPPAAGPTANFGASMGGGLNPLTVQFTDESAPGDEPITSWAWDFGDGGTSALQNPSHVYAAAGLYTVALTVTTLAGQSTKTYTAMIYVHASPAATLNVPFFEEGDIAQMLRTFGEGLQVTVGPDVTDGIISRRTVPVLDGHGTEILATETRIVVKTGTLPFLAIGASLGADARTWRVYRIEEFQDGAVQEVYVSEV